MITVSDLLTLPMQHHKTKAILPFPISHVAPEAVQRASRNITHYLTAARLCCTAPTNRADESNYL